MSDRILLMRRGRVVQEGPPTDLFERPASRFVAEFMNVENLLDGTIESASGGEAAVRIGAHVLRGPWTGRGSPDAGAKACVAIRAERIKLGAAPSGADDTINQVPCRPGVTIYKGKYVDQMLETEIGLVKARVWDRGMGISDATTFWWRASDCAVTPLDAD